LKTFSQLNEVFRSVFQNPQLEIRPEFSSADIAGWDSMSHLTLIMAIEDRFKFRFSRKELSRLFTIGDLMKVVEERSSLEL
jgi:acyl carrier protein